MAVTATVVISASVATVTALAGGSLQAGMTMTYAAQSQPVTPAVSLGAQLTGSTYNVNNLTTLSSRTVTFTEVQPPVGAQFPVPSISSSSPVIATLGSGYSVIPPPPLPSGTGGTVVGIPI